MRMHSVRHVPTTILPAVLTLGLALAAWAQSSESTRDFPYPVRFELGEAEFAPGDSITIQRVTGTSATIRTSETFCVEGTYTLASRDKADLALFATTASRVATPTDPTQILRVQNGSGSFRLIKTMREEGYLHVSFYPAPSGSGFGGVYFGQDKWVLRQKGWSYLKPAARSPDYTTPVAAAGGPVSVEGPNRALLEYLGDPVEPPANMDAAYSKDGLIKAMQDAAQKAGISLKRVDIDDSEFPFLVGVVCAEGDWEKLKEQFGKMSAYNYTGRTGGRTHNALNLVPSSVYPSGAFQRINHRTPLREQMLLDRILRLD